MTGQTAPSVFRLNRLDLGFFFLLALPRFARMIFGQLWIEDDAYLDLAWRLSQGQLPYQGFPLPHLPLLEGVLALAFLFPVENLFIAELLSQLAIFVTAVGIYLLLRDRQGRTLAFGAGLVFSLSSLNFRYHLWERETFLNLIAMYSLLVVFWKGGSRRVGLWLGLLLFISLSIKLTGIVFWLALTVSLILAQIPLKRLNKKQILSMWLAGGGAIALCIFVLASTFYPEFIQQTLLIHLTKGANMSLAGRVSELAESLNLVAAVGLPGLFFLYHKDRRLAQFILIWICLLAFFYFFISPTFWPHNAMDFLLPFSFAAGATVSQMFRWAERRKENRLDLTPVAVVPVLLVILVSGWLFRPFEPDIRHGRSVYGFGYRDREEIARVCHKVRAGSKPGDRIVGPALIAAGAQRMKWIAYREIANGLAVIQAKWKEWGPWRIAWSTSKKSFYEESINSAQTWQSEVLEAIREKQPTVVVNDMGLAHYPYFRVPTELLRNSGYKVDLRTTNYEVWSMAKGNGTS